VNVLSPGDRVLALSCGRFGERLAAVARSFGADVILVEAPWGRGIDPQQVTEALRLHAGVKAVLVTHNETSTGVTNDLRGIAQAVRGSGALLLVDAVSSLGAIELQADAWGLDVVVTGSQKALMGPPGAVFINVSPRAWEAVKTARMPKHYFSFAAARDELASDAAYTPFTPAIPVVYALAVSIPMILREGLPARFAYHRRLAELTRRGVQEMGLELFADARWASETVTAVKIPTGVSGKEVRGRLWSRFDVAIAGGQGALEGKIFRIGHMGYVQEAQILDALQALEHVLAELGHRRNPVTSR
ncbi:MAG: pyridoxal-phosphate-dependent aminotransferase family protein, partial [bacterium]